MHNRQLHGALAAFAEEAAWQLSAETADGAEIPFEVVRGGRRDSPLYCYRPLTGGLHRAARRPALAAAELPARRARAVRAGPPGRLPGVARGARLSRPSRAPARSSPCACSSAASSRTRPTSRSAPSASSARIARSSRALYDGRTETVVIAPLLGFEIASPELAARRRAHPRAGRRVSRGRARRRPLGAGRAAPAPARRRALGGRRRATRRRSPTLGCACGACSRRCASTTARAFAFGPLAWTRTGGSPWQPFALGALGAPREEPIRHRTAHRRTSCAPSARS